VLFNLVTKEREKMAYAPNFRMLENKSYTIPKKPTTPTIKSSAPKPTTTVKTPTIQFKAPSLPTSGYDKNLDYAKAMQDYVKSGGSTTDSMYKTLQQQRNAKVASMNNANTTTSSLATTTSTPTTSTPPSTGGGGGGINYEKPPNNQQDYYNNYFNDMQKLITQRRDADLASQLAAINSAYNQTRGNIESQRTAIPQQAQELRNQNEAIYFTQQLPALYAAMEAAGQRGGENITGMVGLNTARGQNMGDINMYEANQLQAIQDALTQLDQKEADARIQAQSGVDANTLQQLVSSMESSAKLGQSQEQIDLQAVNDAYNRAFGEAGLTGVYNGQPTMAQKELNYQISRDKVMDDRWLQQFNADEQQRILDNAYRNRQISLDEYQAKTSRINASNQYNLSQQQFNYNKDQDALQSRTRTLNNAIEQIDSLYTYTDPTTGQKVVNTNGLRSYILSLKLDDNQTDQLLRRYGVY
jgi:hypothetical protein